MRSFFPGVRYLSHPITHLFSWGLIGIKLVKYVNNNTWINTIGSCIIGMIFVDLLSALGHWASEAFRSKKDFRYRPKYIIQEHHTDVLNYSLMTYGERLSIGYYFIPLHLMVGYVLNIEGPIVFLMIWSCFIFISHTWSHEVAAGINDNLLVKGLQRFRICLPAYVHSRHHFWDTTRWFGFLNGISDYITNPLFVYILPNYETFDSSRQKLVFELIRKRKEAFNLTGSLFIPEIDNGLPGQLHPYCRSSE